MRSCFHSRVAQKHLSVDAPAATGTSTVREAEELALIFVCSPERSQSTTPVASNSDGTFTGVLGGFSDKCGGRQTGQILCMYIDASFVAPAIHGRRRLHMLDKACMRQQRPANQPQLADLCRALKWLTS
jgi:hypothetical protein